MQVDIDVGQLSKMERGELKFSKELILKLADLYKTNSIISVYETVVYWYSRRV
jgi:hypothetical protein